MKSYKKFSLVAAAAVFAGLAAAEARAEGLLLVKNTFTPLTLTKRAAINANSAEGRALLKKDPVGNVQLSATILNRAAKIGYEINRTGGYRFDGYNDCYGFVRRVWNDVLKSMKKPELPTGDYPSKSWAQVTNWAKLKPGEALATHQGHKWGGTWHGGLFVRYDRKNKTVYIMDCSSSQDGVHLREMPAGLFSYYYIPTHKLLLEKSPNVK